MQTCMKLLIYKGPVVCDYISPEMLFSITQQKIPILKNNFRYLSSTLLKMQNVKNSLQISTDIKELDMKGKSVTEKFIYVEHNELNSKQLVPLWLF